MSWRDFWVMTLRRTWITIVWKYWCVCVLSDVTDPGQVCVFIVLRSSAAHKLVNTYPLTLDQSVWHLHTIWHPSLRGVGCVCVCVCVCNTYTSKTKTLKMNPVLIRVYPCLLYWTLQNPAAGFCCRLPLLPFPFVLLSCSNNGNVCVFSQKRMMQLSGRCYRMFQCTEPWKKFGILTVFFFLLSFFHL